MKLTAAENAVAQAIAAGLTVRQVADSRGVRVSTVRAQVRTIFDKLGVRRQVDLVRRHFVCWKCGARGNDTRQHDHA
jgi:DNA-binding NarL/FixJ family response regulator